MLAGLRSLARAVKREVAVYRLILKDPRTPRLARWLLAAALGYFLSPIDAIVDTIPFLGLFDDVVVVGGLTWLAMRLIPPEVVADCRSRVPPV